MGVIHLRKGGLPLALLVVLVFVFNTNCCRAAFLVKSNLTIHQCNGSADECLMADDFELEFLMDSHVSRMIQSNSHTQTEGTLNSGQTPSCGDGISYKCCMDKCCKDKYQNCKPK